MLVSSGILISPEFLEVIHIQPIGKPKYIIFDDLF
jgi:hypothetical protein